MNRIQAFTAVMALVSLLDQPRGLAMPSVAGRIAPAEEGAGAAGFELALPSLQFSDGSPAGEICDPFTRVRSCLNQLQGRPTEPRTRASHTRPQAVFGMLAAGSLPSKGAVRPFPQAGPISSSWNLHQRSVQLLI